jgi:hypothetical protein
MSATTWSTDRGNWSVSNGNTTATHFGTNNTSSAQIAGVYATTGIPVGAKTYVAFAVTGAVDLDALVLGVGVKAAGSGMEPSQFLSYGYNGCVDSSGNLIVNPIQPDGKTSANNEHALVLWGNDTTPGNGALTYVVFAVDRTTNQATISYEVPSTGVHKFVGTFAIPNTSAVLFPFAGGWNYKGDPSVTILPGKASAAYANIVPGGYTPLDSTGGGSGPPITTPPGTGGGSDVITVNRPASLVVGNDTITGHESDPSQPVYLSWRTSGVPVVGNGDVVKATVAANGNFSAVLSIDHAGTPSTIYAGTAGALTAKWTAVPLAFLPPGNGGTPPGTDKVTVNKPTSLAAAVQTLSGTETDPTQAVYLDWHTSGQPTLSSGDWVKATVNAQTGKFTATLDIDHAGTASTLYEHTASGSITALWSAIPT